MGTSFFVSGKVDTVNSRGGQELFSCRAIAFDSLQNRPLLATGIALLELLLILQA